MISRISSKYRSNKKLIILKDGRLLIRPVKHPDEADPGSGFFLSETDMEEYNLLVRPGSGDKTLIQIEFLLSNILKSFLAKVICHFTGS